MSTLTQKIDAQTDLIQALMERIEKLDRTVAAMAQRDLAVTQLLDAGQERYMRELAEAARPAAPGRAVHLRSV